jgi:hypothetical protein
MHVEMTNVETNTSLGFLVNSGDQALVKKYATAGSEYCEPPAVCSVQLYRAGLVIGMY